MWLWYLFGWLWYLSGWFAGWWWWVVLRFGVGRVCGGSLGGRVMWFVCGAWLLWWFVLLLLLLLLLEEVLCEGAQKVGAARADEQRGWVATAADDELQHVGRQRRGEEEGI